MTIRTLADALREAREGRLLPAGEMRAMGVPMSLDGDEGGPLDTLTTLEDRIALSSGPVNPDNPPARCDFCPRTQAADMMAEVEPGRYACDGCTSRWAREARRG